MPGLLHCWRRLRGLYVASHKRGTGRGRLVSLWSMPWCMFACQPMRELGLDIDIRRGEGLVLLAMERGSYGTSKVLDLKHIVKSTVHVCEYDVSTYKAP